MFKYISDLACLPFICSGQLKFSPVSELNDPVEVFPLLLADNVEQSLSSLRENGYTADDLFHLQAQGALLRKLAPEMMAVAPPRSIDEANALIRSSFYGRTDLLGKRLLATAELIAKRIGVLCLTSNPTSVPMWAHYANRGAGALVEFYDLDVAFPGDASGVLNELLHVEYGDSRTPITFDPKSHRTLFTGKLADWAYEQEIRVVMSLEDCELVHATGQQAIHVANIAPRHIKRVIFGWRVDDVTQKRWEAIIGERNPCVATTRAWVANGGVVIC